MEHLGLRILSKIRGWKQKLVDFHVKTAILPTLLLDRSAGITQREYIISACCWAVYLHPKYLKEILDQLSIKDYTLESVATHTDLIEKDKEGHWIPKLPWSTTSVARLGDYPILRNLLSSEAVLERIGCVPGALDVAIKSVFRYKTDTFPLLSNPQTLVEYWQVMRDQPAPKLDLKKKLLFCLYHDVAHLKAGHMLVFKLGDVCLGIKKESDVRQYGYTSERWGLEITLISRNMLHTFPWDNNLPMTYSTIWRK